MGEIGEELKREHGMIRERTHLFLLHPHKARPKVFLRDGGDSFNRVIGCSRGRQQVLLGGRKEGMLRIEERDLTRVVGGTRRHRAADKVWLALHLFALLFRFVLVALCITVQVRPGASSGVQIRACGCVDILKVTAVGHVAVPGFELLQVGVFQAAFTLLP